MCDVRVFATKNVSYQIFILHQSKGLAERFVNYIILESNTGLKHYLSIMYPKWLGYYYLKKKSDQSTIIELLMIHNSNDF